jgi:hypothetical protein
VTAHEVAALSVDECNVVLDGWDMLWLWEIEGEARYYAPDESSPDFIREACRLAYADIRSRYDLVQVWLTWHPQRITGTAEDVEPDFSLDPDQPPDTAALALMTPDLLAKHADGQPW